MMRPFSTQPLMIREIKEVGKNQTDGQSIRWHLLQNLRIPLKWAAFPRNRYDRKIATSFHGFRSYMEDGYPLFDIKKVRLGIWALESNYPSLHASTTLVLIFKSLCNLNASQFSYLQNRVIITEKNK